MIPSGFEKISREKEEMEEEGKEKRWGRDTAEFFGSDNAPLRIVSYVNVCLRRNN